MSLHSTARLSEEDKKDPASLETKERTSATDIEQLSTPEVYKLYKRRWFGIVTLVRLYTIHQTYIRSNRLSTGALQRRLRYERPVFRPHYNVCLLRSAHNASTDLLTLSIAQVSIL